MAQNSNDCTDFCSLDRPLADLLFFKKISSLLYSSDLHVRSTAISALRSLLRSYLKLNNLEEAYGLGIDAISVCTRSFTFVMMLSRVSVPSLPIKICHDVRKSQTY